MTKKQPGPGPGTDGGQVQRVLGWLVGWILLHDSKLAATSDSRAALQPITVTLVTKSMFVGVGLGRDKYEGSMRALEKENNRFDLIDDSNPASDDREKERRGEEGGGGGGFGGRSNAIEMQTQYLQQL